MPVAKIVDAQRDFSAGEIDIKIKRADQSPEIVRILKSGARQMANLRIQNGGAPRNRPGRSALYLAGAAPGNFVVRTEEITIATGTVFRFEFFNGGVNIYDTGGAVRASQNGLGWTTATLSKITYAVIQGAVYIACPGSQPIVMTWNGGTSWSYALYAEQLSIGSQKRTFFYRLSPKGITLALSAAAPGSANLIFSAGMALGAGHVGTRIRYTGRQLLITSVSSPTTAVAALIDTIPSNNILSFASDPRPYFNIGDVVTGTVSGGKGIVTAIGATSMHVQPLTTASSVGSGAVAGSQFGTGGFLGAAFNNLFGGVVQAITTATNFSTTDIIVGPSGSIAVSGAISLSIQEAVTVWDEEVMNAFRGWPGSVFADQGRLGFCDFPSVPRAIGWSAINNPADLYVEALPTSAMLEFVPDNTRVLYVVPGPESAEFVFCATRLYYIAITAQNPLKPGSVGFQVLSSEGCAQVQPRAVQEVIIYVNAGGTSIMSVVAPGAYYRPFETRNLSEFHAHLIKSPIAIAIPTATATFEERYAYVLNGDGTVAVGKYDVQGGQVKGAVGWVPWTAGNGTVDWISARDAVVLFSTRYNPNGITPVAVIEQLDDAQYLDGAVAVNSLPAALIAPVGKGPLWWLAGGAVDLIDQATRMMGTYLIDANGFIIAQNNGGENLLAVSLVAGQAWVATIEPFVPAVQTGQDQLQRMRKRRIARAEIYVANSTGFRVDTLNADRQGPNLPAIGAAIRSRRVPAWNQDDDPTKPPPLRERAYAFKPTGRAHDPRIAFVKDTPGPWEPIEIGMEVTV